ncbi:MAG TPA: ribosome silencing factor [Ruminiclostridium sp.]|nr:ribosome silencing factor [Ruminiclostridium sp.]
MDEHKILNIIMSALSDKRANDINAIDIHDLTVIANYFIIASGTSSTHIQSLADFVEEKLLEAGLKPLHMEGYNSARWILMDYGDVVIHIFHEDDREYYGLERLWQDGKPIAIHAEINE